MKTFGSFRQELQELSGDKGRDFELGRKVDIYVENDKKPKDEEFERAAKALKISVEKARQVWNVYTWETSR